MQLLIIKKPLAPKPNDAERRTFGIVFRAYLVKSTDEQAGFISGNLDGGIISDIAI